MKVGADFRNPGAAQAGGYVLALAGVLVAIGLVFHPLPSGGFEEKPLVMEQRRRVLWHPAICKSDRGLLY